MAKKDKILSQIKLKYHGNDEKGEKPRHKDVQCYVCDETNISIGSAIDAYTNNPKFICEDCTIDAYKDEHGFASRKAAAARRRRMFDVNYLFNEMVVDEYMKTHGIYSVDNLEFNEMEKLMNIGRDVYNAYLSKKDKIKIEEMQNQEDVEKELVKLMQYVNFD